MACCNSSMQQFAICIETKVANEKTSWALPSSLCTQLAASTTPFGVWGGGVKKMAKIKVQSDLSCPFSWVASIDQGRGTLFDDGLGTRGNVFLCVCVFLLSGHGSTLHSFGSTFALCTLFFEAPAVFHIFSKFSEE